jgi:hypothetical protein
VTVRKERSNQLNYVPNLFSYLDRKPACLVAFLRFNRFACVACFNHRVPHTVNSGTAADRDLGKSESVCFQHEPRSKEANDCDTATLVNKIYPRDHPEPKFLDQSNHPLVAAAETPFLTTGSKSRFPLGFAPVAWPYLAGIAVEQRKTLDRRKRADRHIGYTSERRPGDLYAVNF